VLQFAGTSHLIVDVFGWFGPGAGGLRFVATAPQRLVDTRASTAVAPNANLSIPVDQVSLLNVVGVDATTTGFVSVKPCGDAATSSLLNLIGGEDVANAAPVAPANGAVCVTPSVTTDVVVDRSGTFVP
jgi:hypothetical protein